MPAVGTSVARKDGIGKANGTTKYADDLAFPGMLHGRTIRSTIARGRISNIRNDFDTAGFTIVDFRDIPPDGRNVVALLEGDQPFLVEHEVRHLAEPIVLLAHHNRDALLSANVVIEYEAEEPFYVHKALKACSARTPGFASSRRRPAVASVARRSIRR